MARKDISDIQVLRAYQKHKEGDSRFPYEILSEETGQPEKVCYAAMERAAGRGFLDYGVSLRSGWITEKGLELLNRKV